MSEPELWRRANADEDWGEAVLEWPPPEGTQPVTGVVRVPFDEAVERMVPLLSFSAHEDEIQQKRRREWARLLLRAALGGEE